MTYFEEELIKKIITWKVVSFGTTLVMTWLYTQSVKEAVFLTFLFHATLITVHHLFERWWGKEDY